MIIMSRLQKGINKIKDPDESQKLTALSLDSISTDIEELIAIEKENQKIQLDNQKLLANCYTLLADVLTELREDADEGGDLPISGTVNTTDPIFVDTITVPEHPVKSVIIINDGQFSILAGRNVTKAGIQPTLEDVTSNLSRYREVKPGEDVRFIYNRRRTDNVAFVAIGGNCAYRCYLAW